MEDESMVFEWDLTNDDLDNSYEDDGEDEFTLVDQLEKEIEQAEDLLRRVLPFLEMEEGQPAFYLYQDIIKFLGAEDDE